MEKGSKPVERIIPIVVEGQVAKPKPQNIPPPDPPQSKEGPTVVHVINVEKAQQTDDDPTLNLIRTISKEIDDLKSQVIAFNGTYKDHTYLYLDEMLTRNLIRLDNVDVRGKEELRQARRHAICTIEECIKQLEANAANDTKQLSNSTAQRKLDDDVVVDNDNT